MFKFWCKNSNYYKKKTTTKKKTPKKTTQKINVKVLEQKIHSYVKKLIGKSKNLEEFKLKATEFLDKNKTKAQQKVKETEDWVKKHPAKSMMIAALAGIGVAKVMGPKKKSKKK